MTHWTFVSIPILALIGLGGCGDNLSGRDTDAGATVDAAPPSGPLLTHEPAWVAQDPGDNPCYAFSLTVADLDGDGFRDLVVGAPRCFAGGDDDVHIYPGQAEFFTTEPITRTIDWDNANPFPYELNIGMSTGHVDGDERVDILIWGRDGIALFLGQEDIATVFDVASFRAPGPSFGSAVLADVDGDGDDDIVISGGGSVSVYLTDNSDPAQPAFALARSLEGYDVTSPGDIDGDGDDDLAIAALTGTDVYLGCEPGLPTCDGGLEDTAVWSSPRSFSGARGDFNDDGRADMLVRDSGRFFMHVTDPETGALASEPDWIEYGDPLFLGFALGLVGAGDVLGDGVADELLVGSVGRLYLYGAQGSAIDGVPGARLWAWPEPDHLDDDYPGYHAYVPTRAGDLNGDGYADIVAGAAAFPEPGGRVLIFAGGALPQDASEPYIPASVACVAPGAGDPDLSVDAEILARSVQIESREFAADSCEIMEGCVADVGERRLLRFTVSIANLGAGDAIVPGASEAPELYEFDLCHGHDHLIGFARYELDDGAGNVVIGRKQGFYLVDIAPYCDDAGAPDTGERFPSTGITAGWSDVYTSDYDCQWIDITDVSDGTYELRVIVDDTDIVAEDTVYPNTAVISVTIEGETVTVNP